ncbi:Uncharacterised protein [Salmonella bongori]|nr:Uncharacterised protein [Salmonella bongori]
MVSFYSRFRFGYNRLFSDWRHVRRCSRYRLRLINRLRLVNRLWLPGLFGNWRLPLRLRFLRRSRGIRWCGHWRYGGVLRRRGDGRNLLPRLKLRLRLAGLSMRRIAFRRRRDNRFAGLRPGYGLPLHGRLDNNRLHARHRRRLRYGIGGRGPCLGCCGSGRSGDNRLSDRVAV